MLSGVLLLGTVIFIMGVAYRDVNSKVERRRTEIMLQAERCKEKFELNTCERSGKIRALEAVCEELMVCMKRDPYLVSGETGEVDRRR